MAIETRAADATTAGDRLQLFKLSQQALKISGRVNGDLTMAEVDLLPDLIEGCTDAPFKLGSILAEIERAPAAARSPKNLEALNSYGSEIERCEKVLKLSRSSRSFVLK